MLCSRYMDKSYGSVNESEMYEKKKKTVPVRVGGHTDGMFYNELFLEQVKQRFKN